MTRTLDPKNRRLAKKIAHLALDAGDAGAAELHLALKALLARKPVGERRAFLNYLRRCIVREQSMRELKVEHAGPVDASSIEALSTSLGSHAGRTLTTRFLENPDLLGGLRVRLGDVVYDASLSTRLRELEKSTAETLI